MIEKLTIIKRLRRDIDLARRGTYIIPSLSTLLEKIVIVQLFHKYLITVPLFFFFSMKRLYVCIYIYVFLVKEWLSGETSIITEWDPAGKNTITCTAWCKLIHQKVPKYRLLNGNFYQIVGELIPSTFSKSGGDIYFFWSALRKYKNISTPKTYGLGGPYKFFNLNLLTLVIYCVWSEFLWKFEDQG